MKRSVSTSSQAVVTGASKRNASAAEPTSTIGEKDNSSKTSRPKTALPPISESSAEHEYEQKCCEKLVLQFIIKFDDLILNRFSFSSIPKLRSLLARIGESTADLAQMLNGSELTIREHCDSIRQQVDIARETELEKIHKESNALMLEVDAYERGCLASWSAVKESTEVTVEDVSKRMREFLAEPKASDDELILQVDATNKLAQELTDHKKELTAAMFDNKLASFIAFPSKDDASFGELAIAHIQHPFTKLGIASTELKPRDIRSEDEDFVLLLDEGRRIVTFNQLTREHGFTRMSCLDWAGRLISSESMGPHVDQKRVAQCGLSEFVVCHYPDFTPTLSVFDSVLKRLRSVRLYKFYSQICCNSKFVFALWDTDVILEPDFDFDDDDDDYNQHNNQDNNHDSSDDYNDDDDNDDSFEQKEQYSTKRIQVLHLDTLREAFSLRLPKKYKIKRVIADEHHVVAMSRLDREPVTRHWSISIFDLATYNESSGDGGNNNTSFYLVEKHIELTTEPLLLSSVFLFHGWLVVPLKNANELVWFDKSGARRETSTKLNNISSVRAIYSSAPELPIGTG